LEYRKVEPALRLLLDTHAMIWLDGGFELREAAKREIETARIGNELFVSAISFWELAHLIASKRIRVRTSAETWARNFLALPGVTAVPLTPEVAIKSVDLPGPLHRDPADRFLIATALELDAALVTRDRAILAYADAGFIHALPC
jgi:PIN domain nuclease of toxin-antitoxin system